jgi:hypothetical protein
LKSVFITTVPSSFPGEVVVELGLAERVTGHRRTEHLIGGELGHLDLLGLMPSALENVDIVIEVDLGSLGVARCRQMNGHEWLSSRHARILASASSAWVNATADRRRNRVTPPARNAAHPAMVV